MEHLNFLEKIRTLLVLSAWGCSILFVLGAPGEIQNVYSVKNALPEKLKIENVYLTSEPCSIRKYCDHIKFEAIHVVSNLPVEKRIEVEPGTFPFGVSFQREQVWSTKRMYLEEYKVGEVYDAYLGRNGRYYLSQGSYFPFAYLLAFAVAWLGANAVRIARNS